MKKILIIDDDGLVLKSIKNVLEKNGFKVEASKRGAEAVKKLESENFDLILCDIRMPDMDGLQTIKAIREKEEQKALQNKSVIFMTGYANEDAPIEAIKLGAKDYILKPFDIDELLESIRKHIAS